MKSILIMKQELNSSANTSDIKSLLIKKKLIELKRFELLLKVLAKKKSGASSGNNFLNMLSSAHSGINKFISNDQKKNYPLSFRFYQSLDILVGKKIGDTKT